MSVHGGKLVLSSLRILANNWRRSVMIAAAFVIAVGAYSTFAGVTASAEADLNNLLRSRAAIGKFTVTAARYQMIGSRQIRTATFRPLQISDADAIRGVLGDRDRVAVVRAGAATVHRRQKRRDVLVLATTTEYFDAVRPRMASGRPWSDEETLPGAVVSSTVARALFDGESAVGGDIWIGRRLFGVTGVMADEESSVDTAGDIVVPFRYVAGSESRQVDRIVIRSLGGEESVAAIRKTLRQRRRLRDGETDDFTIRDEAGLLASTRRINDVFRFLLPALSVISLVAGGVGIFTVMLISVRERAWEIGLRRAIGATRRAVVAQFVIESLCLAIPAAVLGAVCGVGVYLLIAFRSGWPVSIPWTSDSVAIAAAALLSIVCGAIPARNAAAVDPATALRIS